jgi:hypothetical protein
MERKYSLEVNCKPPLSYILTASVMLWSVFLTADSEVLVRFLALKDLLRSSGSGTGSIQPREYN